MVEKTNETKNKSVGEIIDELLNNPKLVIQQANENIKKVKDELEEINNVNKQLEEKIIEKDKELKFLKGIIEGMKCGIEYLNFLKK